MNRFAVQLPGGQFVSILTISPTLPSSIVHWGAVDDDAEHPLLVFTDRAKATAVAALTRGKVVPWQASKVVALASS